MYCIEFLADKVPCVDTGWGNPYFFRIPAGALLAAGAIGEIGPAVQIAAALVGGSLSAGTDAIKAGDENSDQFFTEPFSNWTASIGEDVATVAGLWAAFYHPVLFLIFLVLFIFACIWLLPKLSIGIKKIFRFIGNLFQKANIAGLSII